MKLSASLRTPPEFAIFSSIERGSADPTSDIQHWLSAPDGAEGIFRQHPNEKRRRTPSPHNAEHPSKAEAAGRAAIHAPEYRSRFWGVQDGLRQLVFHQFLQDHFLLSATNL